MDFIWLLQNRDTYVVGYFLNIEYLYYTIFTSIKWSIQEKKQLLIESTKFSLFNKTVKM